MTVSIKRLSAGTGYRYLMKSVAAGDGDRSHSTPLTRYYNEAGTPPGQWLGSGLAGLDHGKGLGEYSEVTEQQMFHLFGMGNDPVTGEQLSARPYVAATENRPASVAGFDLTFSAMKSVSVLWALADAETRQQLLAAHHAAISSCISLIEAEVAATRIGTHGVAQAEVRGVIAAAFDHWDSRAGDPQLHTHVVVANRVQTADGTWRTLDGKALYASVVAISATYNALLADEVTRRVGVQWNERNRPDGRRSAWEISGVSPALIEVFSQRSHDIEAAKDDLASSFPRSHGRLPTNTELMILRQQATLATRPDKKVRPIAELAFEWRSRASQALGQDADVWAKELVRAATSQPLRATLADCQTIDELGRLVVETVSTKRSTWSRWNLHAEASRQLMCVRFASSKDRLASTDAVVDAAIRSSVLLSAPALAYTPPSMRRADGTSMFDRKHGERYSSIEVLDAEERLLRSAEEILAPKLEAATSVQAARTATRVPLSLEQLEAVASIAASGRTLDLLVGPAGTGKTATLAGLRAAWESQYGSGSVVGLAPSASAAEVLSIELGIAAENTSKWLTEADREPERLLEIDRLRSLGAGTSEAARNRVDALSNDIDRWRLHPGQLLIVDEASLAGTRTLARIAEQARDAGAKLVLVGDSAQLSSIDAGGAFAMLVKRRSDVPELGSVRRFTATWEGPASKALRVGDLSAIDQYRAHGRIASGDQSAVLDAAFTAWMTDESAGLRALLLAGDGDTVHALNTRARQALVDAGIVERRGSALSSGHVAGVGDRIVTRKNNRLLSQGSTFVKNGDEWRVTSRHGDGSLSAVRADGGQNVRLPAAYVAEHVDLAYATTAYRSQGRTVDTAHAVVADGMTREVLYVAMTRGRSTNMAYVVAHDAVSECDPTVHHEVRTADQVLAGIVTNVGADIAAHDAITEELERTSSIAQLADEYESIASAAQKQRWQALVAAAGMNPNATNAALESPSWGALTTALRRAESLGLDVDAQLPRLVASRGFDDAEDPAAVLHERVTRWAGASADLSAVAADLIVGLVPRAIGVLDPDVHRGLAEREALIEARAAAVLQGALDRGDDLLDDLGPIPTSPDLRQEWRSSALTVVAFRDRFGTGRATSADDEQRALAAEAVRAARRASTADRRGEIAPERDLYIDHNLSNAINR